MLAELDLLGSEMYGAKIVAQRFQLRSCAHKDKPVPASQCLQSLIGEKNDGRYLMATQVHIEYREHTIRKCKIYRLMFNF